MSAGFTPGPWEYRRGDSRAVLRSIAASKLNRSEIARVMSLYGDTRKGAEAEANAILIAAAPDLYAALEHILAGALSLPRFAEDQARAALSKARGDSSIATLGAEFGADPALAVPAKPVSRLGASRCDPGESK